MTLLVTKEKNNINFIDSTCTRGIRISHGIVHVRNMTVTSVDDYRVVTILPFVIFSKNIGQCWVKRSRNGTKLSKNSKCILICIFNTFTGTISTPLFQSFQYTGREIGSAFWSNRDCLLAK